VHPAFPILFRSDQHLFLPVQHDGGRGHRVRRLPQPRILIAAIEYGLIAVVVEKDFLGHGMHWRLRTRSLAQRQLHIVVRGNGAAETVEIDAPRRQLCFVVVQTRRAIQMNDLARSIEDRRIRCCLAAPASPCR